MNIKDTAGVTSRLLDVNLILPLLQQQLGVTSRVDWAEVLSVKEVIGVKSTAYPEDYSTVRERIGVSDAIQATQIAVQTVREIIGSTSRVSAGESSALIVSEQAGVTSQVTTGSDARVREVVGVRAFTDVISDGQAVVGEVVGVRDRVQAREFSELLIADQIGVTSQATVLSQPSETVRETVGITARAFGWVGASAIARERVGVASRVYPVGEVVVVVRETASVSDRLYLPYDRLDPASLLLTDHLPLEATDVWTADMRKWGMSRYVGFPLIDFVDTQFGVSPAGVYTTDGGMPVSYLRTGRTSLSKEQSHAMRTGYSQMEMRKRVNYVYTYSVHEEPLHVVVGADYNGVHTVVDYTQDQRSSDKTRAVRCTIGRGFASNYIQLTVGGTPFDMALLEAEITPTGRRI